MEEAAKLYNRPIKIGQQQNLNYIRIQNYGKVESVVFIKEMKLYRINENG